MGTNKMPIWKKGERERDKEKRGVPLNSVRFYVSCAYVAPFFHGNLRISNTEQNN